MAVVVEPVLTQEKLLALLAEGHEQPSLDYKKMLDLNERRDLIELTKDLAAMQAEIDGGYIVVGADDHGVVVQDLSDALSRLFDEATLRSKFKKYVAEPFDLRTAVHKIQGANVALVYVGPGQEGWSIFTADGTYEDPKGSGRQTTVFRVGEVFVRRGTASVRWQDADRVRLVRQIVQKKKEEWRADFRRELAEMNISISAQAIERMPSSALSWRLDTKGFDELVVELIRRGDDIPLRSMLLRAPGDAKELHQARSEDLNTLLDRVTSVAALGLTFNKSTYCELGLQALVKIYELGVDQNGVTRGGVDAPQLWLTIIDRVYALGGLAVRGQKWAEVRSIANRKPRGQDFTYWASWLRHALTMAARAEILEQKSAGLIARAHNVVRAVPALHLDVDAESDEVLNSLCQFDVYGGLVNIGERGDASTSTYYTNFARYYTRRSEPAFLKVIQDAEVRRQLFAGDQRLLATAIARMDKAAQGESFMTDGWDGLRDPAILGFLAQTEHD